MFIDTHQDTFTYAVAAEGREEPTAARTISSDPRQLRKALKKLDAEYALRICYEADGSGYELSRQLRDWGYPCEVMAPSLTPKKPGDHRKNDQRDAKQGAKSYRAGDLTPICVPTVEREEERALVRCRNQLLNAQKRFKYQLNSFLRTNALSYRDGKNWTKKHLDWIRGLALSPSKQFVVTELLLQIDVLELQLQRCAEAIEALAQQPRYRDLVAALRAFRGFETLTAVSLCVELGELRRFATPGELMSYLGLTCGEDRSSDHGEWLHITKAGNSLCRRLLVEASWHYEHTPGVSRKLRRRQEGVAPEVVAHAWNAQKRLHKRFWHLARRKNRQVAVVAVARELAGFVWAVATQLVPPPPSDCADAAPGLSPALWGLPTIPALR
ncbi:MAG: IS110 family transposase [Acidobacteriota bacterium]